jgi:hypothetical protein
MGRIRQAVVCLFLAGATATMGMAQTVASMTVNVVQNSGNQFITVPPANFPGLGNCGWVTDAGRSDVPCEAAVVT